uniref:Complement C4B (Chido/Rodgers blood group) n=1 Tax=Sander lucioperca TaxID=283035 RepID=A0A8C9WYZ5_SANLU
MQNIAMKATASAFFTFVSRFFISAPRVFHVGVNEKVFVQMGKSHLNNPVTLYLRHEISQTVVSARKTTQCAVEGEIKIVENLMSTVTSNYKRPTLALMAESPSFSGKKITHVLVSQHRGYIFIQTDQPIYNPTQKVRYRIFTLDHTFRPHEEVIHISVINAAGNRVMKSLRTAKGGILQDSFSIPDVSKMGTWKVTAHYEDDKANAASREFKVQKFVLPSFEVNIQMKPSYILSNAEQLDFTILAKCAISYLRDVRRCFSIVIFMHLISALYCVGGEIQEAEVYLPIISHKYTLDFSRTRSYFLPGYPLDVVVCMKQTNGYTAMYMTVMILYVKYLVCIIGCCASPRWLPSNGLQQSKVIQPASSPRGSYLYISLTNKMYSVGESLTVNYNTINGPTSGFIYYMVLSRGIIIQKGSLGFGTSVRHNLQITPDMVPSFRLIGYYYNQHGDIIADSVWVDVRDECEIKVKVEQKGPFEPGKQSTLEFDLHGQKARVALLAVDKAIYALNADNKLTAKQVFSSMQSYDLGCSYSGGSDPASVLTEAGLSFVSQSQSVWKKSFGCNVQSVRQRRSVDLQQEMMTLKSNFSNEKLQDCCVQGFSLIPMRRTCLERAKRVSLVEANPVCTDAFLKCCLEGEYVLTLPDSITTWEIQVVTLSAATGFCVVKPSEVRAFKRAFVSLRLPYSVKKYEQLSISPVIYNYGDVELQVAVHMEQTEGLCSPGSATTAAFVNITVKPESSQFVSFSAVPMVTGSIPIKIRLFDMENEMGIDAVEKTLNVLTEGLEKRVEHTLNIIIDGSLPDDTVPGSSSNIFVSVEGDGFGSSHAKNLLSPEKVASLIVLPRGCLEQTTVRLAPTASALRYLDLTEQWFDLPAGYVRILDFKNEVDGSYRPWRTALSSNWVTALIVKVLSLVAQRQTMTFEKKEWNAWVVPEDEIRHSVRYLLSVQNSDGSFSDPHRVLRRRVLVTSISYMLEHAYNYVNNIRCSNKLSRENGCYLWTVDASPQNQANADAMTVETTAYALLATVELGETEWADRTACWLITQENYAGGFKSTQDTVVALEALAEYELKRSVSPEANLIAEFTVQGKTDIVKLALRNKEKVETDLKVLDPHFTVNHQSFPQIVKSYYLLDPKDNCDKVSISVTVEGKVKYTAKVIENYEYYDDYGNNEEVAEKEVRMPRSAIEWFDARTRNRRDLDNNLNSDEAVTYKICVSLGSNLTGMAIADITLLSGFEAETKDLDRVSKQPERYISHYEVSYGRVLLYFNELFESEECISFDAKQNIPIGLLQPAPAVFYDYYEPNRKCTVFYSAPQRSKMVSTLCSEDVCQCAESSIPKLCSRTVQMTTYIGEVLNVSMKSNFELYEINVNEVLRSRK